jgi:hypothetical protein
MGDVYYAARHVLIWLGEGDSDVVAALSLIDKIGAHQNRVELSNGLNRWFHAFQVKHKCNKLIRLEGECKHEVTQYLLTII